MPTEEPPVVRPPAMSRLLSPTSVAVVGPTHDATSVAGQIFASLLRSFTLGPVVPIDPTAEEVQKVKAYRSVASLPEPVDLAVVAVPAPHVPGVVEECAAKGVGAAVVIVSSPQKTAEGAELQRQLAAIARSSGLGVLGPNSIGYFNIGGGVRADLALTSGAPVPSGGPVALVAQGDGFGSYLAHKALLTGVRIGWFVSTGNEADVDVAAVLRHLVERDDVKVLLSLVETVREGEVFVETAMRAGELDKPMIVLAAQRGDEVDGAGSGTASIFSSAKVFAAVCHQYGIYLVDTVEQLFDLGLIFQDGRRVRSNQVGVVTASGGAGVLLADACVKVGLEVPELPRDEQEAMLGFMPAPFYGSTTNPVDTTAQGVNSPGAYEKVLNAVADSRVVEMLTPVTWAIPGGPNDDLIRLYQRVAKPVAVTSTALMEQFQDAGVPTYTDPQRAASALSAVSTQSLRTLDFSALRTFRPVSSRVSKARRVLASMAGDTWLSHSGARQVLGLYGVLLLREELVHSADEAVAAAARIGGSVTLTVSAHDNDSTGSYAFPQAVRGADNVRAAYADVVAELEQAAGERPNDGVVVQESLPAHLELRCRLRRDRWWGPMVALGMGGLVGEIMGEVALLRAPLGEHEAVAGLRSVFGGRLVASRRGLDQRGQAEVARLMAGIGTMGLELDDIEAVDAGPILVGPGAVRLGDARFVLRPG